MVIKDTANIIVHRDLVEMRAAGGWELRAEGGVRWSEMWTEGGVGGGHEIYSIWYSLVLFCSVPRGNF